jgi:hypothetical protein
MLLQRLDVTGIFFILIYAPYKKKSSLRSPIFYCKDDGEQSTHSSKKSLHQ